MADHILQFFISQGVDLVVGGAGFVFAVQQFACHPFQMDWNHEQTRFDKDVQVAVIRGVFHKLDHRLEGGNGKVRGGGESIGIGTGTACGIDIGMCRAAKGLVVAAELCLREREIQDVPSIDLDGLMCGTCQSLRHPLYHVEQVVLVEFMSDPEPQPERDREHRRS